MNKYQQVKRGGNRPPRRKKKRRSFAAVILTIFIIAILCVAGLIAAIYASGVRYIKVNVTDDLYVKFLGQVDENGEPYKGRLIYSDGVSADVNLDRE